MLQILGFPLVFHAPCLLFFRSVYLHHPHRPPDPGLWRHEPRVGGKRVAAQPGSAPVPLLLYGVAGGRPYARSPHQERTEGPAEDGGQFPQVWEKDSWLICHVYPRYRTYLILHLSTLRPLLGCIYLLALMKIRAMCPSHFTGWVFTMASCAWSAWTMTGRSWRGGGTIVNTRIKVRTQ